MNNPTQTIEKFILLAETFPHEIIRSRLDRDAILQAYGMASMQDSQALRAYRAVNEVFGVDLEKSAELFDLLVGSMGLPLIDQQPQPGVALGLSQAVREALAQNPTQLEELSQGKPQWLGFLVNAALTLAGGDPNDKPEIEELMNEAIAELKKGKRKK